MSNAIEGIRSAGLCTGCGLCEGALPKGKISVRLDEKGFYRPKLIEPLTPIEDSFIKRICPGVRIEHPKSLATKRHPIWGPIVATHGAHAVDPVVRRQGSSGGAISALLIHLLETRAVDYVVQIGADTDDPIGNGVYQSRTRAEVLANAGSRYAPSAPLAHLDHFLQQPGRFAFVGKPCDVAGLRNYLAEHPEHKTKVPFLLSFMCAGIPSRKGTLEILKRFEVQEKEVSRFRYRGNGWPGMTRVEINDGRSYETDYNTSWGTVLNRHLQFRCKICPDGIGEFADVVGADAWYGKDGYPDFTERDGRSLLISRTEVGESLIRESIAARALAVEPIAIDAIAEMQPYQKMRKTMLLSRLAAMVISFKSIPQYKNMFLFKAAIQGNLREQWRNFKGMIRRIIL